ncbi:MAG: pilus assembly protein TadG-related protein [Gemmataceae bacterium]
MLLHESNSSRRGAIAPLAALLLIPLLAMLAFAVDLGWITHTHNQLQAAADAAALAGAGSLTDNFVKFNLMGVTAAQKTALRADGVTRATATARTFAGYHPAGEVANLNLLAADVELGYTSPAGVYTTPAAASVYPNTVKVTLRRETAANGPLPLFFARVLGIDTVPLTATARATIYGTGGVDTLTAGAGILPMTYDVNHWDNFVATGKDPDGNTKYAADGYPHLNVYPSIKFTGNFGELSLNQSNNGSSTIRNWIADGITASDVAALQADRLIPLSAHNSNSPPDWKGNPGLKTSTIQEVGNYIGEVYLLPLFKPVKSAPGNYQAGEGQGSNYYYTIVRFVPVLITAVDATGNDKAINVRPTAYIDPDSVYSTTPTAATASHFVFIGAKLVD